MIARYIRTLVVMILVFSAGYLSLVIWQSEQRERVSSKSIHYHAASINHLDKIHKEIQNIRTDLLSHNDAYYVRNGVIADKLRHEIYIIDRNYSELKKIEQKYQDVEFDGIFLQLQQKFTGFIPIEEFSNLLGKISRRDLLLRIDSILLTLEQLRRLHAIANNRSFAREDEQSNIYIGILLIALVVYIVLVGLITKKTLFSVTTVLTKQQETEDELSNQKEQIHITLESIGDAVISTDKNGLVTYMNPVAEELTQWSNEEATGLPLTQVFNIISEETGEPCSEIVRRVLHDGAKVGLANHTILISRDGSKRAIEDSAAPIIDKQGMIQGIVVVFHDVTSARKMAQEMTWQASHDALTHLANRYKFENELTTLIESGAGKGIHHAFLYIDLDQFKIVNDTCGHVAGDELLKQVAMILRAHVRDVDTVARLGGDEFGILLASCTVQNAIRIANGIRDAIQNFRFVWQERVFTIGISIGLVPISSPIRTMSDIMSAADIACYAAKDIGGNRIHVFQEDDEALALRQGEMEWVSRITHALEEDRFVLYQQPILPLQVGNSDKYFEILLRMTDENGKIITPMSFIPAAERYNLMSAIDRWVITNVFKAISALNSSHIKFFSLNISGQSLGDEGFLNFVEQEISRYSVPPHMVCFEITETAAISNFAHAIRFISFFKEKGCRFSLDDFGSGLSSFGYLKNLPVDCLKIDGAFVQDMLTNPIDQAMVESINNIGHLMGIKTIAEFVEHLDIAERLRELGVDYGQGYGLAKPVPFSAKYLK